jgi:hypothetical protein
MTAILTLNFDMITAAFLIPDAFRAH